MALEGSPRGSNLIDVLDRVLDKGIVIDAWVRVSFVGIDLLAVEARVVVASIATYLQFSNAVGNVATVSKPMSRDRTARRLTQPRRRSVLPLQGPAPA
jgi:gas vesicle structural protein